MPSIHADQINSCHLLDSMACEECKYCNTCHRKELNEKHEVSTK